MTQQKHINVKYLKGYDKQLSSDDVYLIPVYGHAKFSTSGVKRFHNVLMTLCGVSGIARDLMDWLTMQMDNDNRVYNTRDNRNAFIGMMSPGRRKPVTHSAVNSAFVSLRKKGLLIDRGRSCFMVNPMYFINSANEDSRPRLIRMVLEFSNDNDTVIIVKK